MPHKSISTIIELASQIKKLSGKEPKRMKAQIDQLKQQLIDEVKNF